MRERTRAPRKAGLWLTAATLLLTPACGWNPFEDEKSPMEALEDSLRGKRICVDLSYARVVRKPKTGPNTEQGPMTFDTAADTTIWLLDYTVKFAIGNPPNYPNHYPRIRGGVRLVPYVYRAAGEGFVYAFPMGYVPPETLLDLLESFAVQVLITNTKTEEQEHLNLVLYRALVGPEITYENTVWGKLRAHGTEEKYAWHVADYEKLYHKKLYTDPPLERGRDPSTYVLGFLYRFELSEWKPNKAVVWKPGEKEAYDELAKTVSLTIPLTEDWEAYDLEFIPAVGHPVNAHDGVTGRTKGDVALICNICDEKLRLGATG